MALPSSKYIGAGTPNLAVTGGVLVAPLATALPTGAAGTIDPAFKALGYVSEDGIESMGERKIESVRTGTPISSRSCRPSTRCVSV